MFDLDQTHDTQGEQDQGFQGRALVAPLHIRSICAARDKALTLARQAADQLNAAYSVMGEADEAARAAHRGFRGHRSDVAEEKALKRLNRGRFDADESIEAFRFELDAGIWTRLIEETQIDQLMDFTERRDFEEALRRDVPPATAENIFATMERLTGDADLIFKRGIARCFAKLDPAFKSHDCFKIGKRMIFTSAFSECGSLHWARELRDTLNDVERVFSRLDGRPSWGSIVHELDVARRGAYGPRQTETDTGYFKARGFMNGNLHLWIRPECKPLLDKVNRLLADYYGEVLPDAAARDEKPQEFKVASTAVAKDLAFYPTPGAVADLALRELYVRPGMRVLEPSAGVGGLVKPMLAKGAQVDAIEIHPDRAAALEAIAHPGLRVRCANFLNVAPEPIYDAVVMNPPFEGTHCLDHVRHAYDFLGQDGVLIAILPASAQVGSTGKHERFQAWAESKRPRYGRMWTDLPPESFASLGVRINTVILELRRWG